MQGVKGLFIPTCNSGVTYWRMYNPVNAGVRTRTLDGHILWWQKDMQENHPWQNDIMHPLHRARITGEIQSCCLQADVVVMGMAHAMSSLVTMQGIRECYGKPVVVETDDNVLSCPTYNPASPFYDPNSGLRKLTVAQMREADALIVSTPNLKEVYSEFNEHIYVMPNSIDFTTWGKPFRKGNKAKGKVTIGWAGGGSHVDDLAIIIPAIEYLTKKYRNVEFLFLHGASPAIRKLKGVRVVNKFERIDKYPQFVASHGFDIGIAPLVDNAFNRGKSNLRWLEYSALGVPTVASNVGHFKETIRHGQDGLLCNDFRDFIIHLESLITDTAKRRALGNAARERVRVDFNIDKTAEAYAKALKEIADRGQVQHTVPDVKDSNHKATAEAL